MELTKAAVKFVNRFNLIEGSPDDLIYCARDYAITEFVDKDDRLIFMGAVAQLAYRDIPTDYRWSKAIANWPRIFPNQCIPTLWEMQTSEPAFITD